VAIKRIIVLGCSGSGKSTLAPVLAARLALPFLPTDGVYWTHDWRPTPQAQIRAWVDAATSAEAWVLDGNFDAERDLVWARADLAVWLDLPFTTTLWRVTRRNLGWWIGRQPVWVDNRMTPTKALTGIRHTLRSHAQKHRAYPEALAKFPQLQVVRLTSPAAVERWLASL
jgi:adenylate kinase family enzyme